MPASVRQGGCEAPWKVVRSSQHAYAHKPDITSNPSLSLRDKESETQRPLTSHLGQIENCRAENLGLLILWFHIQMIANNNTHNSY